MGNGEAILHLLLQSEPMMLEKFPSAQGICALF